MKNVSRRNNETVDIDMIKRSIDIHMEDLSSIRNYRKLCDILIKFIYSLSRGGSQNYSRFIREQHKNSLLEAVYKINGTLYEIESNLLASFMMFSGLDYRVHKEATKQLEWFSKEEAAAMSLLQHFGFAPGCYRTEDSTKLKKQVKAAVRKQRSAKQAH